MKKSMMFSLTTAIALAIGSAAQAKLPPPTPEAKAAADLAKAKADHGNQVAAYQLCLAQDKVAKKYKQTGKDVKMVETPPCKDPGKFVPPEQTAAAPAAAPAAAAPAPAAATAAKAPAATPPAKK